MSDAKKNENDGIDKLTKIVVGLCLGIAAFSKVCYRGLNRVSKKDPNLHLFLLYWFIVSGLLVYFDYAHLRFLVYVTNDPLMVDLSQWFASYGMWLNALLIYLLGIISAIFFLGIGEFALCKKYQKAISLVGIKNSKGDIPQVKKVIKVDEDRTILKVLSPGLAPKSWEDKKEDLAFEFREIIDDIKISKDKKYLDILLSENDLADYLTYSTYEDEVVEPFHFIVGKSKNKGLISHSIRACPHLLIGGVSGYGKSTAFKLMLYSLLKNTPPEQIKMSLLDLKRGIEVSDFQDFPNISISKTEAQAVTELEAIVKEMYKRYDHLESIGKKNLDPNRDKMPIIVLAVDEASVIFGARSSSSSKKKLSDRARELCEEIAKLGRASGIHMILATQKATKTSLDANTAENLEARLCFRTRTVSGSNAILGHKKGSDLPDIKGRAIWQKGGIDLKVQVPFISEKELESRCKELCESYTKALRGENTQLIEQKKDQSESPFADMAS